MNFLIGYGVSLVGGGIVVWAFLAVMRRFLGKKPESGASRVPPWLTGAIERGFFTTLVAFNVPGTAPAMMGWLAIKLATNWNHPDWKEKAGARTQGLLALLGGLISMLAAVFGGFICSGVIKLGV